MTPTRVTVALGVLVMISLTGMYVLAFVLGAEPIPLALVAVVALLALFGGIVTLRTSRAVPRPRLVDVVIAMSATAASLFMTREMGMRPLVAAAMIGVVIGVAALADGPLDAMSSVAGYSGSMVGLLAPSVTISGYWVVAAGAVAGLLWSVIGPAVFDGVGGRMGVVAYMGSSAIYLIADLVGANHNAVIIPSVDGMAHAAIIPIGAAGAVITWVLVNQRGWGFVLASALTSLIVCGVIGMSDMGPLEPVLATAWFGGTFVGGTAPGRLPNPAWLALAGALYGSFMLHFEGPLQGHVGVIGATGTIACFAVIGLRRLVGGMPKGAAATTTAPSGVGITAPGGYGA
jgi:hypothetical protein